MPNMVSMDEATIKLLECSDLLMSWEESYLFHGYSSVHR